MEGIQEGRPQHHQGSGAQVVAWLKGDHRDAEQRQQCPSSLSPGEPIPQPDNADAQGKRDLCLRQQRRRARIDKRHRSVVEGGAGRHAKPDRQKEPAPPHKCGEVDAPAEHAEEAHLGGADRQNKQRRGQRRHQGEQNAGEDEV